MQVIADHLRSSIENSSLASSDRECLRTNAEPGPSKVVAAAASVAAIGDEAVITTGGFVGSGSPECVLNALRKRFEDTASPKNLHLLEVASTGNRQGRGLNVLAREGLISKYTFGWTGNCLDFIDLIKSDKIEAWNLPLGVVSHMIRDAAAGRPGPITTVGLATFVDPRNQGGKLNNPKQADVVELLRLNGREYLWYKAPKVDVAILRGTSADVCGNISFEKECFYADALNQAIAAHNNGGLVIVQVERLVASRSLPMRAVHIPAALVDKVVVAPLDVHWQSMATPHYEGSLSGELRTPLSAVQPLPLDARKIIAHRCMLGVKKRNAIVNLGVGMPEGVAVLVNTHAKRHCPHILPVTLSTEVGMMGGIPSGGHRFGASYNADAVMPTSTMIDLIQGGGLDTSILGCAEVDAAGNVNVSRFSGKQPGCGGFIDISQTAKQVIFAGTFTGGGLQVKVEHGRLCILQEGSTPKFLAKVQEVTFAGTSCRGRDILYVTERCVFRLEERDGEPRVVLSEIAPGIRLKQDVLDLMEFAPLVGDTKLMDERCFQP